MHFSAHCISFHLSEFDPEAGDAFMTIVSIPRQYDINDDQVTVSWLQNSFICTQDEGTTLSSMPMEYITPLREQEKATNDENCSLNQPTTVTMPPNSESIPMTKQIV
jgi:hypothetical protein